MSAIVLGYCCLTGSRDVADRACEAFRRRASELGLFAGAEQGRHALAVSPRSMTRPRTLGRPWRVVHFEGALHGRQGLAMHGVRPDVLDDAAVVEQLLDAHGDRALSWLLGDWAVVACSPTALLLATDYFGNRALFYHQHDDGGLLWSNHDWLLAEYTNRAEELDKLYFAGFFHFLPPPGHTPFRGILAVPPGSVGSATEEGLEVRPYWFPRQRRVALADSREYARTFFDLLRDGVRERLSLPGRKWIEVSGGVDSALIAACASSCVRDDKRLGPIEAVHYTTERPEGAGDTRRAAETALQHGLPLRTFSLETLLQRSTTAALDDPREPLGAFREVTRVAHHEGVSVLMSGRLGDLVTGNCEPDPRHLLDLARREGLKTAARALYAWAVFAEIPVWSIIARLVRDRMLSSWDANLFQKFNRRTQHDDSSIGQDIVAVVHLWQASLGLPMRDSLSDVDAWWWFAVHTLRLSASYRNAWGHSCCDRTYPFSHRPLVEFVAACPWNVYFDAAHPRRLIHEHLGSLLPRSLVGNVIKSDTGTWRSAPLKEIWTATLGNGGRQESMVLRSALCDSTELDRVDAAFQTGRAPQMALGLRLIQTELWLRSRPRRLITTIPQQKGGGSHAVRKA